MSDPCARLTLVSETKGHAMSAMKAVYTQLQIWGINPETATDEDISAAFNVCFTLDYENGGWA